MAELAKKYTPKSFPHLKGLKGISDGVLESHFKLYEGYVNRTNKLTETLFGLAKEGQASGAEPGLRRDDPSAGLRVQRDGPARVLLRQPQAGRLGQSPGRPS